MHIFVNILDLSNRKILVFDIETCGDDFYSYPQEIRDSLTKYCTNEDERLKVIDQLAFNALTAQVVCIGLLDHNDNKGCVLFNTGNDSDVLLEENKDGFKYICGCEKDIILKFWDILRRKDYNLYVTFNGREFDCPFIILRSIYHRIKPSVNLMKGSDFTFRDYHIDLLKELTFNVHSGRGARRKFPLDFYCRKFNIESPKSHGVSGDQVALLYKDKKYQEIADYCINDIIAENELFKFWNDYLSF